MADTALKFGPEWLRALTEPQADGGGVLYQHQPLPNIKLAEFRYGKEEILALFDKNVKPPEELVNFGSLFVEKCQFPLNLMQVNLLFTNITHEFSFLRNSKLSVSNKFED